MPDCAERLSAFDAHRLTSTTFLVRELDDIYNEEPFIYVKIVPEAQSILIMDTGCGGASKNPKVEVKSLREFIETVEIADNDNKPLNPGCQLRYVIVLSHCHYDHICRSLFITQLFWRLRFRHIEMQWQSSNCEPSVRIGG
jgi:glyoxylase-like metal-dependent hydrolase (beta-lactamase superfamily II)